MAACRLLPAVGPLVLLVLSALRADAFAPKIGVHTCVRTAPFPPRVHTFGNTGLGGGLHAALSRFATWSIDMIAYDGVDMREALAAMIQYDSEVRLRARERNEKADDAEPRRPTVLDVGCGTGTLTQELLLTRAFESVTAVDTSEQMIGMARWLSPGARYEVRNGVDVRDESYDAVVFSMIMHEMPASAHVQLLDAALEATRGTRGKVWVADVHPSHAPSPMFLSGEPYVLPYLSTFEDTVRRVADAHGVCLRTVDLVPNHVRVWTLAHP